MTEESNQASVPKTDANSAPTTAAPSVGRISAPLPPPRTMPFGPSVAPPPPSRTGRPTAAPPPPSRAGSRSSSGRPLPPPSRASIPDMALHSVEAPAPSSPSQISATEIDSVPSNPAVAAQVVGAELAAATAPSNSSLVTAPKPPSNTGLSIPEAPFASPVVQAPAFQPPVSAPSHAKPPSAPSFGSAPSSNAAPAPAAGGFAAGGFAAGGLGTAALGSAPGSAPAHGLGSQPQAAPAPAYAEAPRHGEANSTPGAPPLDHVFATEDEPESQDGSVLSAGRVLSQPVDRPSSLDRSSIDPSTPFTDDDEDEATRVLDNRESGLSRRVNSALKSSLRSSVAPPPPPGLGSRPSTTHPPMSVHPVRPPSAMPPPSAPPMGFPSRIPPAAPAPGSSPYQLNPYEPPSAPAFAHLTVPPKSPTEKPKWPVLALAAGIVAASLTWFVLGTAGSLLVTVSGPGNSSVKDLKVFVNGTERCTQTPCEVKGLSGGSYIVRAEGADLEPSAEQAIAVEGGKASAHNIQLKAGLSKPLLTVTSASPGVRVLIDGKDRGTAPLELSDIAPGQHTIRVEGEGFEAVEQSVNIVPGTPQTVGPLTPRLIKGALRMELGANAEGAQVLVNGKSIRSLPATLELDAAETHDILVRKAGFEDFQRKVTFSATEPKLDLTITLLESSGGGGGGVRHEASEQPSEEATPAAEETPAAESDKKPDFLSAIKGEPKEKEEKPAADSKKPGEKPAATGKGTLNINSVPPTTVLLDGKPLGKTPRAGVSVPAGSHSVTFIHPEKGRKQVKVDVPSGGSKNVTIRL